MFLAAAPYFQTRFQSDPWILANSQSAILTVSTIINLLAMLILTNIQSSASYPFRISTALLVNAAVFAALTVSTSSFLDASAPAYLAFLLLMVALAAWAAGLMQNGAFAFAAGFGRPEYTQAIMAGQGVAGILPPLAQMLSFLAFSSSPPSEDTSSPAVNNSDSNDGSAAFIYFLTAVFISCATLLAFVPLARRYNNRLAGAVGRQPANRRRRHHVGMATLLCKLRWPAAAVFACFLVAMFFPVFTGKILSVRDPREAGRLFAPGAFIPLGFFFWNLGDLAGRVATGLPCLSLGGGRRSRPRRRQPAVLMGVAVARVLFLPMYLLCNLHGSGAVVESDLFYLLAVQFPFGLTNGWLGSSAMMAAGEWVGDDEREAAGGFMGLCLVAGLAAGSMLSFTAAGI